MTRIFLSVGHGGLENGLCDPGGESTGIAATQEMIALRDVIVQVLRSRSYDILAVPDELGMAQAIHWINARAVGGDVALALHANGTHTPISKGTALFYIANNDQRRAQAEQLLQAYLRRVPHLASRGVQADTQTYLGSLAFCRWVSVPSLLMEVGLLAQADDRRMMQTQRQDMALGIAEGLVLWSRGGLPAPTLHPPIEIHINGAAHDDQGLLVEGNAYVPLELAESLGIDLPIGSAVRRIDYGGNVYVRAVDLRDFNIAVTWESQPRTVTLRSVLGICMGQIDRIMGHGYTSEVQLMMFLKSHHPEGLTHFADLPKLYREEGSSEGVNYDIAFAQMCIETNYLRFSGAVKPEQNNFASLGDAAGGANGASFPSARIGVRAQIQHLKAYASTEPLVQAVVDPRFRFVRRGIAPQITHLSGRWMSDSDYGTKVLNLVRRLYEFASFL